MNELPNPPPATEFNPRGGVLASGLSARLAIAACTLGAAGASAANASEALQWGASYQADLLSTWKDGFGGRGRALDSLHLTVDSEVPDIPALDGLLIHADLNVTSGAAPNDDAQTLQGVDNIEVSRARTRLYELWAEQRLLAERASIRVGYQELNSEFYATDAAGILINPSFGLSPELSATGSNGPSTYPSTAIAARAFFKVNDTISMNIAAFNADALTVGDVGGPDYAFDHGALFIGQVDWNGPAKISIGAWGYTDDQDDLRETDAAGDPVKAESRGVYFLAEKQLFGADEATQVSGFFRGGVSDGDTTQFDGGWQAGLLIDRPIQGRAESAASIGVAQALTSAKNRANERDMGIDAARSETIIEVAYSDKLAPWLTVQPDLQFAMNPGADRSRDATFTAGLRLTIQPWSGQ